MIRTRYIKIRSYSLHGVHPSERETRKFGSMKRSRIQRGERVKLLPARYDFRSSPSLVPSFALQRGKLVGAGVEGCRTKSAIEGNQGAVIRQWKTRIARKEPANPARCDHGSVKRVIIKLPSIVASLPSGVADVQPLSRNVFRTTCGLLVARNVDKIYR